MVQFLLGGPPLRSQLVEIHQKALTIKALSFIATPPKDNFNRMAFGITFSEDLVPTNNLDKIVSTHFMEIYRARLWALPFDGNSSSLKPKQLLAMMLATTPLNWSIVMYFVTWVDPKTFINDSL